MRRVKPTLVVLLLLFPGVVRAADALPSWNDGPARRSIVQFVEKVTKKAKPEFSHGVRFFTSMRDLVAAGFFSSKVGVADLQYMGNVPHKWDGPPPEVLQKLGVG